MAPARAAAYIGGAVMLAAWLAAAASTSVSDIGPVARPAATPMTATERLAADLRRQSARLRERLASAPAPQQSTRNPFSFGERDLPRGPSAHSRPGVPVAAAEAPGAPVIPPVPILELAGIAEQQSDGGPSRTAIIVDAADGIYMVTAGQTVIGRYTVVAIGADAVELKDSVTGSNRRLALR